MSLLLRKIQKSKWYKNRNVGWLAEGEIQADALSDLRTLGNCLSFWRIKDDQSNLTQVIAALGAKCETLSNIDYALIDASELEQIGIEVQKSTGASPDRELNESFHFDAVRLTASSIHKLAIAINEKAEKCRILPIKVGSLISERINRGAISRGDLNQKLLDKLS